jgi:hypothetical protein
MRNYLPVVVGAALAIVSAGTSTAQEQTKESTKTTTTTVELTGCVSLSPAANGQFAFVDATSGGTYRLSGKNIKKYAGQRVKIVGDPSSKRVQIRTGLWPSPNIAAQAGALDPAQESIARNSGGANMPDARAPELRVVRMNGVEGACQ